LRLFGPRETRASRKKLPTHNAIDLSMKETSRFFFTMNLSEARVSSRENLF